MPRRIVLRRKEAREAWRGKTTFIRSGIVRGDVILR